MKPDSPYPTPPGRPIQLFRVPHLRLPAPCQGCPALISNSNNLCACRVFIDARLLSPLPRCVWRELHDARQEATDGNV